MIIEYNDSTYSKEILELYEKIRYAFDTLVDRRSSSNYTSDELAAMAEISDMFEMLKLLRITCRNCKHCDDYWDMSRSCRCTHYGRHSIADICIEGFELDMIKHKPFQLF